MKTISALYLSVVLTLLNHTALANTTPVQPEYYQVSASLTAHLNVRAEPSASARDIGDLNPGARPIEVLKTDPTGEWGHIVWQETTGWVALRFLERITLPQLQDTIVPIGLICAGTEPFWTMEIESPDNAVLSTEASSTPMSINTVSTSRNRNQHPVALELLSKNHTNVTVLSRQACSDGLTNIQYNWAAEIIIQPEFNLLSGCCVMR